VSRGSSSFLCQNDDVRLPRFRPIGTPESLDFQVVLWALSDMSLFHVSMSAVEWEKFKPDQLRQVIVRRRVERNVLKKLQEHASSTGRPITENSVLRVMEFWHRERVHMLVFRDSAHMDSCVKAAIVKTTLEA
jgi:hypothetical protein